MSIYIDVKDAVEMMCPFMTREARVISKCLASGCMCWRWENPSEKKGFCGMAGLPTLNQGNQTTASYDASDRPAAMAEKAIEGTA